jgi:predicted nucleotidyltransferase
MKIDRGKLIAGQKLKVVREILRDLRHCDSFGTGAVNANETFLNWITEVRVFGSYLTDTDDLGDLDLAIKLARRPNWTTDNCIAMADAIDQQMLFHEKLNYPEKLLRQKIRNRSPYISLHYTDELDRNPELGGKTIYKFPPPKPKTKAKKMTGKQRAAKKVK